MISLLQLKIKLLRKIQDLGGKLVTLKHPSANIGLNTTVKERRVVIAEHHFNLEE